jgi:MFS family permease
MPRSLKPVLAATFMLSFAAILLQRGIFFFLKEYCQATGMQSLLVALVTGAVYVVGAFLSHRFTRRVPERRALLFLVGGMAACAGACLGVRGIPAFTAVLTVFSLLVGMAWPVMESYATAGLAPQAASRSVGLFSVSWSLALPLSVWAGGHLIGRGQRGLFAAAIVLLAVVAATAFLLPRRPDHHPAGGEDGLPPPHPEQRPLLQASRWAMALSYALLLVLVPLLPNVFKGYGYPVAQAGFLAGLLDVTRPAVFAAMLFSAAWHGRRLFLFWSVLLLPAGFAMTLLGASPWVFISGELLFGVAASVVYYSALYYAMVLSRGSVDGGGGHEAVVGAGFTLGPLAAMAGHFLGEKSGHPQAGLLAGVAPVVLVCLAGTFLFLKRAGKAPG